MRRAMLLSVLLGWAVGLRALDPLPIVQQGPGYRTWTLEQDLPLLKLEDAMAGLRSPDQRTYLETLHKLGIVKELVGRELAWPQFVQPIKAEAQFMSFERRKLGVLTAPIDGHHKWYAVILRQEGNGEAYWRARQVFVFDTDPVEGYAQDFPDILGDDIRFWEVRHIIKDDIYGRARVTSIFKWDERGRARLTFQEMADAYRTGKLIGEAQRLEQQLIFKGDQRIVRKLKIKTYPWMKRDEFDHYQAVNPKQAEPSKVVDLSETFAWDPADFNFYGAEQELEKLVKNKSPYLRREAARRLGEHEKTAHPQLIAALKDKDQDVRMQAALALAAIADPAALPGVEKALQNVEEPDEVRDALTRAEDVLTRAQAAAPAPTATEVPPKPKALEALAPIKPSEEPRVSKP